MQLGLFADRTSSRALRSNQLRLYFSGFAYVLLHGLRRLGLKGTANANLRCDTLRLRLLKIAARIKLTHRRIWLALPTAFPWQVDFARALANLLKIPHYRLAPG